MRQAILDWATRVGRYRLAGWVIGAALLAIGIYYGGRAWLVPAGPIRLIVYAYSTQEEVLTQAIFPAVEQAWQVESEQDLFVEGGFGPSGTVARQIILGAPADVALLSNEQHVNWLKAGRWVRKDARSLPVSNTPMVIVVRPGNPADIAGFADLARPGLRLLHADPRSSGAGDWALLAEYGSALRDSGDPAAARATLRAVWSNVRLLAPSARAALTLFELGAGDALVTYEQDARLALDRGVSLEIVVPSHTILAEHVAVIVDANVTRSERTAAQFLLTYLLSDAGQQALHRYHLRSPGGTDAGFPVLDYPFTVQDLGGWPHAYSELVETFWQGEIAPYLELEPAPVYLNQGGN